MKSLALLVALLTSTAGIAQTPYIETFELRLQNLDVIVTDAKGKPIRGLTKEDFVVVENGKPQPITNFAIYDQAAGTASSAMPAAPAAEAEPVVSAPPPRRFVFFVDELGVQRAARQRLYDNVKAFVDAMRPGDVAAVVRPTAKERIAQEFTGDRAAIEKALKAAIDDAGVEFSGSKQEITNLRWQLRNAATPPLRRAAKREYSDVAARRVAHRLGQLRALTSSLSGVEGKKIVVLVAMGLSAKPGSEAWDQTEMLGAIAGAPPPEPPLDRGDDPRGARIVDTGVYSEPDDPERTQHPVIRDYTAVIQEVARSAAAAGVTIYALEPDVPLDLAVRQTAGVPLKPGTGLPDPALQLPPQFQTDLLQNAEVTLSTLTRTTGGRWFRGLANIDDIFRQVDEDSSFYYSLAYRATGEAEQGKRVSVSVRNRPELRVRTRTEVLEKTTDREMSDLVVASLLYPRTVNELGIKVTPGTPKKDRGLYIIPVDVVIPLGNLTFLPADGGKYAASFDLHFAAAGERRDFGWAASGSSASRSRPSNTRSSARPPIATRPASRFRRDARALPSACSTRPRS